MINERVVQNPWENVYWFSRMLINSDRYAGVGAETKIMRNVAVSIHTIMHSDEFKKEDPSAQFEILAKILENVLLSGRRKDTNKYAAIQRLLDDLLQKMETVKDFEILSLTCDKIIIPINQALKKIPNDDTVFVESIAKALLDAKGINGLSDIIVTLDDIGSKGCMAYERSEIVRAFGILRNEIGQFLKEDEMNIVLTAFAQEFERRMGQKRKGRAGRGIENITGMILNYFGIKATQAPEHFTTGLEIDKWVRTKDGWTIGISCKRTLRERWKQAYTTDLDLLNRHKIKELWHVIAFDKDLSDDKITEIGSHRAVLYLPDESSRLKRALEHPGMKDYVRPMTHFIDDLKKII